MTLPEKTPPAGGQLGTFGGVFTPSILTILGIILFMRLGYVVGSAGLGRALIILALANVISVLTSVSLSAVATNLKVKGGGDYYLISRTLGVEYGGAIGIVLFLAQSVSIAFYCIGFGEATREMLPPQWPLSAGGIAALAVSFLFIFAWLGADWATKFQYIVMALLASALVSFFAGGLTRWDGATFAASWAAPEGGPGFWVLFAIFFPAVTGFTQGVSMSGDLKDPLKSLPTGTFLAVGISIVIYFAVTLVFAGALPLSVMAADYGAMKKVAWVGPLIDAGVIAATLSSAMASFLGGPRILQSLAADRVFPLLVSFSKGSGPSGNPRRAVLLSAAIAYLTIALGNLNLVASVVSMFFLISYGLLNYATYFEARTFSPSFRPRFRLFDHRLSLFGWVACLGTMLAIDLGTGVVAVSVIFGIYQYIRRTAGPSRWADSQRSYNLQQIRENLLLVADEPEHPRDWRPQILAFSDDPDRRARLLHFASWIEGRSGLTSVVRILEGQGVGVYRLQKEAEEELLADIRSQGLRAFSRVVVTPDMEAGAQVLVQAFGVGPLKANTILLNWLGPASKDGEGFRELRFGRYLRVAFRLGCNIVLLDSRPEEWAALDSCRKEGCCIDVWWFGDKTSRLMLLLAYLMTRSEKWEGARLRVLAEAGGNDPEQRREALEKTLEDVRIEADIEIVEEPGPGSIREKSAEAALVFLPFRFRANRMVTPFHDGPVEDVLTGLPITALVIAAEEIDLEAEPEEGIAGKIAAAQDALAEARKKMLEAEREAARALAEAEGKDKALSSGEKDALLEKAEAEARAARKEAEQSQRKASKAKAKAEAAEKELEALGVAVSPEEASGTGKDTDVREDS